MAVKPERATAKKKPPAAVETSASIEAQTAAFLAAGGKIENVDRGVSGQQTGYYPRTLNNRK
jgi:SutA RNAP-binding domain